VPRNRRRRRRRRRRMRRRKRRKRRGRRRRSGKCVRGSVQEGARCNERRKEQRSRQVCSFINQRLSLWPRPL